MADTTQPIDDSADGIQLASAAPTPAATPAPEANVDEMGQASQIQTALPETFAAYKQLDPEMSDQAVEQHLLQIASNVPGLTDQQGVQLVDKIQSGGHDNDMRQAMFQDAVQAVDAGKYPDITTALAARMKNAPAHFQNAMGSGNGPAQDDDSSDQSDYDKTIPAPAQQPQAWSPQQAQQIYSQVSGAVAPIVQQQTQKWAASTQGNGVNTPGALSNAQGLNNSRIAAQSFVGGKENVNPVSDLSQQQDLLKNNMANGATALSTQNTALNDQALKDPNSPASQAYMQMVKQIVPTLNLPQGTSAFTVSQALPAIDQIVKQEMAKAEMQVKMAPYNPQLTGMNAQAKATAEQNVTGSKAQQAVDTNYGKDYADYVAAGGASQVAKSISQVQQAIDSASAKNTPVTTGGVAGLIQSKTPTAGNLLYPKTTEARQQIEGAVATTLKQLFPGRILQSEVSNTMSRVWNPQLDLPDNLKNTQALLTQLKAAAQAKDEAATYYQKNGSLKDFQGKIPQPSDFENFTPAGGKSKSNASSGQSLGKSTSPEGSTKTSGGITAKTVNGQWIQQ